ncbi:hypothetical protein K4F52_001619 [Lecanicillium sp. MT-2017a]|nr:hypothetical protein K4F52_001619 [Lecanicillium sp. MT-2017a]
MHTSPANPPSFYLNIHTTDTAKTEVFFKAVGFTLITEYSDDKTKSFRLPSPNDNIAVMIHAHDRFKEFIRPNSEITNAHKATEGLFSIAVDKKEEVDAVLKKATEAGGTADPYTMENFGAECGMYTRSFADLDGHIWEVCFMLKKD